MPDMIETIIEDTEEIFAPKPGGLVDRHRQKKARDQAEAEVRVNADVPVEQNAARAVKVAPESPEVFSALTFTIPAGGRAQILPISPYRYRAVINVATAASSVILAKDEGMAVGQTGFTLGTGLLLPLFTRAQVYAMNPGGSPVQVSVLAEIYAPEKHLS